MQVGDWVEFETIVIKQRHAAGSTPAAQALTRKRRGMVIGQRQVYDVTAGSPPTLSNPQRVLLVAISLHRCYRVFPNDARLSTPPHPAHQRAQRRQPQVATGITIRLANGGGPTMGRTPITPSDLELLVADQMNQRTTGGDFFTAYDITLGLRDANPGLEIPHAAVRRAVHEQMKPIMVSGVYDSETAMFGGASATRYVPL